MKVEQFYNKNQFHLYGNGQHILQSYNSTVVIIEYTASGYIITLGRDWDYSKTTSKHVYLFLEEYLPRDIINLSKAKGNKRAYIQKLIDNHDIGYNEELR